MATSNKVLLHGCFCDLSGPEAQAPAGQHSTMYLRHEARIVQGHLHTLGCELLNSDNDMDEGTPGQGLNSSRLLESGTRPGPCTSAQMPAVDKVGDLQAVGLQLNPLAVHL